MAMNYTGFGQDPSRIYSFRLPPSVPQVARMAFPQQAMAGLKSSRAYLQAGRDGRQRMETLVGMGLPAQTDISKVRAEGMGTGSVPRFSAPRPLQFGSYSGFGPTEEQRGQREAAMVQRQVARSVPAGGPQPAQKPSPAKATEIKKAELGESGEPLAFTPFGDRVRQESQPQPRAGSPFPAGTIGSLTGFGGIPRFPFANY